MLDSKFKKLISSLPISLKDVNLLVGLSGGIDSMVLTYLLNNLSEELKFKLYVYHLHHGMRIEADDDIDFLIKVCKDWSIPLKIDKCSVFDYAKLKKVSIEEAGRILRYEGLREHLSSIGKGFIVTAHNADDQVETIFYRLLQGVGIRGLKAMEIVKGDLLRPLLPFYRNEIVEFANYKKIPFLVDSYNFDKRFLRNKIRLDVFPDLMKINPGFKKHLFDLANDAKEIDRYFEDISKRVLKEVAFKSGDFWKINRKKLINLPQPIIKWVFLLILEDVNIKPNRKLLIRMINLLNSSEGSQIDIKFGFKAKIVDDYIVLPVSPLINEVEEKQSFCYILNIPGETNIPESEITLKTEFSSNQEKVDINQLFLPFGSYKGPLIVRSRKPGDVIKPRRLKGHSRKIQDILIDKKIEKNLRDKIPLLVDNENVLWLIGFEKIFVPEGEEGILISIVNKKY